MKTANLSQYRTAFIDQLREQLRLPLPGRDAQERMIVRVLPIPRVVPPHARLSAVLCLLFPVQDELNVLLMKRREDHTAHSGQVSFPGGRHEDTDADLLATALREAHEEVGIRTEDVEVLGPLTSLYIPVSNFHVFPFVGYMPHRPDYHLSHHEVSYTLDVPLAELFRPERKTRLDVFSPAIKEKIPNVNAYQLTDGTVIWGATAMMLSELETVIAATAYLSSS